MSLEKLQLLEDKVILPGRWYPNTLSDGKGNILIESNLSAPAPAQDENGRRSMVHFSQDAGKSWTPLPDLELGGIYCVLRDGSVVGLRYHNVIQDKLRKTQANKPFIAWLRRAPSLAALAGGDYEDDFVPMYIPELDGTDGDSQNYCVGFIDHGFLQLPNGDLLCTMYGRFRGDDVPVPYFPQGAFQYRCWCCVSKNGGKTWDYLQTIGSNDILKLPAISEGYCEPDMVQLAGGDLLCVIRTGGSPSSGGNGERYTPMMACRSADGGATWTKPEEFYRYGVWPNLLRMQNGLVVCTAGRPGVFLMESGDDGATWSAPEVVDSHDGDWGYASSGYNTLEEIEPGVLALFYDEPGKEERYGHSLRMRTYRAGQ